MAVDIHLRFSSIDEFEKALCREKKVRGIKGETWRRRKNRILGVIAAVLVIAAGFTALAYYYNQERLENTLPDSIVEFWYAIPDTDELAEAKQIALEAIVEAFIEGFPGTNARIVLKPFPEDEYIIAINEAYINDALPSLFESTGVDESVLRRTQSVENAVRSADLSKLLFYNYYDEVFPDFKQFPLGFAIPARYKNIAPQNDSADVDIDDVSDRELFLSGIILEYFGSTKDFYDVQEALPARYTIEMVDGNNAAIFTELLSIGNCDADQLTIVNRFLVFLLSENAQDYLHIQFQSGSLPLNKSALTTGYVSIYEEFAGFFNRIEDYSISR